MYTFGCFAALTGLIIARLKESTSSVHMTASEESWFGKYNKISERSIASFIDDKNETYR